MAKKSLMIVILFLISSMSYAQEVNFSYMIQRDGKLVYVGERDIIVSDGLPDYRLKGWNTDGRYFITIIPDPNDINKEIILLHDLTVPESFPLITDIDVDAVNPIYFGTDRVLFTETTPELLVSEDEQGLGVIRMNVYEWAFEEGSSAVTLIGSIPYGVGCGGGGVRNPLDSVYSLEIGGDSSGEYNQIVFVPTPHGIVHSNGCTAIRTLLTNPETLESIELSDNLRWSAVSPNGDWVVGSSGNQLQLINLETLEIKDIATADAPIISSTWTSNSGGILYVVRSTSGESLPIHDPDGVLDAYDPDMTVQNPRPEDALQWESTIYRYDILTEGTIELYRAPAYAIGRMTRVEDNLIFSQIETPLAWVQASVADPPNLDTSLIPITLWQFNVMYSEAIQIADDLRGVRVQPKAPDN